MDKEYFMNNAGMPPPQPLNFDTSSPMAWNLTGEQMQSFFEPNSSKDQYSNFESALSSMVSSPVASTSALSNESFVLRELIGKLGGIGGAAAFPAGAPFLGANHNNTNDSCYSTPINSPPKLYSNLGNSTPPPLPSLSADPGFAERAAKFSCFGSRSFNGRTSPFGPPELSPHRSTTPLMGNGKMPRVASSPALKQQPTMEKNKNSSQPQPEKKLFGPGTDNSNEESSVSEQTGSKTSNEMNSRKRKGIPKGKSAKGEEEGTGKRSKQTENGKNENKTEEKINNDENEKEKSNQKPPEPPKDYIHVRARRGQATDSHSLAERVRREKISERMKLLQDLVPGCNKVTGKALMLDEIINYVQSLQRQVEFLSMKLASVNPGLEFNMDSLLSKDQSGTLPQQMYPLDSSTPTAAAAAVLYQNVQQRMQNVVCRGPLSQCSVDPLPGIQLPSVDGFSENLPQFPPFGEDDLHSIVQMGFGQNLVNFPVPNQTSDMKVER